MIGTTVDSPELPTEATDSPIWKHLQKRGRVDINDSSTTGISPLNIYYEVYGGGAERIVFINGMRANHQMWEENVEQFLKLGNYECLVYDHRGTGYSDTSSGVFSITSSTLAYDLKRLMDVLKWSKANIVSVSMGGMIALDFACNNTDMVKTLTLGATSAKINIPLLTGVVDSARVIFSWNSQTKFRNICLSKYTHEHLLSPAPSDSGCNTMLDYYSSVAKRKAKYRPRMAYSTKMIRLVKMV
ncbi:hypothetical protein GGI22_000028 [Coemansia erecta]|nr:hypothetical protein GGI22_000028 [Coemansia erecta]